MQYFEEKLIIDSGRCSYQNGQEALRGKQKYYMDYQNMVEKFALSTSD